MTNSELAVLRHHLRIGYETGVFDQDFDIRWDVSDNIEILEDALGTYDKEMENLQEDYEWIVEVPVDGEEDETVERTAFQAPGIGACVLGPDNNLLSAHDPDPENPIDAGENIEGLPTQFVPDPDRADKYWEDWEALMEKEREDFDEDTLHKRTRDEIKEAAVMTEAAAEQGFNQSVLKPMIKDEPTDEDE